MPFVEMPEVSTREVALSGCGDLLTAVGVIGGLQCSLLVYDAVGPGAIGSPGESGREDEFRGLIPENCTTSQVPARMAIIFQNAASAEVWIKQLELIRDDLRRAENVKDETGVRLRHG